ncbi:hypothetical protein BD779DRAFT_1473110 [Infundibulicybe gibba]|nr:hypothetical protein BD779DRAFT_1473110 [Infundibulicybe gibba]
MQSSGPPPKFEWISRLNGINLRILLASSSHKDNHIAAIPRFLPYGKYPADPRRVPCQPFHYAVAPVRLTSLELRLCFLFGICFAAAVRAAQAVRLSKDCADGSKTYSRASLWSGKAHQSSNPAKSCGQNTGRAAALICDGLSGTPPMTASPPASNQFYPYHLTPLVPLAYYVSARQLQYAPRSLFSPVLAYVTLDMTHGLNPCECRATHVLAPTVVGVAKIGG